MNLSLLIISIIAFYLNLNNAGLIFLLFAFLLFANIFYPFAETYVINGNVIKSFKVFLFEEITIPKKSIIVISSADIHPPFGYQSILLKDRLTISILQEMPLDCVMENIHGRYKSQFIYTNSTIERTMDKNKFVYSCIYTKDILENILKVTSGLIIIPESLKGIVVVPNDKIEIHYDIGW